VQKKLTIKYLYHLTHFNNLKNILDFGLLSRNELSWDIEFKDIADIEVLSRRRNKKIFGKNLFDFVSLYFKPNNPMLYKRKEIQDEIIILAIDGNVLLNNDTIFSDGNASSSSTNFYKGMENLQRIDWKVINAKFWNDFEDGKRKACAEALVYSKVSLSFVKKILCNNINVQNKVIELINNKIKISVELNKNYYFKKS
jgi:hypothetical protein